MVLQRGYYKQNNNTCTMLNREGGINGGGEGREMEKTRKG